MILRRLSQSLKEQNWTAIWIEFVLLVAGVFLGIQVSNWNQAQKDRETSRAITENLHIDYAEIEAEGRKNKVQIEAAIQSIEDALALMRDPEKPLDGKALREKVDLMFNIPQALQESATQQELIFSGRMGLVANDDLRVMLVRNNAQITLAQKAQQARREFVRPYTAPVMRLRMLLTEGYPAQQAIELAGGKPDIQIGLHASRMIFKGELNTLERSLESLRRVRKKLDEQRAVANKT
jgi:hypothetical protein